jgi:hypothetical protein
LASYKWKLVRLLKGTVASIRVWLKVVWMERAKAGEDPLRVFIISTIPLT